MSHRLSRLAFVAAVAQLLAVGCVQSRPSRNGVFNENQYIRKDFLIQDTGTTGQDPGWMLLGTVTAASTPNPLGSSFYSLSPGINSGQAIPFRFVITEDTLEMVSTVDISSQAAANPYGTPTVINAWPITNVDLQYQVNLDGETTNFYQTNQERPWQQREWVQVDFDKNNMADLAPLGEYTTNLLSNCVDSSNASTTLVTNSFITEPPEASASTPVLTDPGAAPTDYMEWTVNVTLPLIWDDENCVNSYGYLGVESARLGKYSETLNLKYSMERALPLPANPASPQAGEDAYQPLIVAEKDLIRHKYGFLDTLVMDRDPSSGLLAANDYVDRFDPTQPIVWYFAPGFNESFKAYYTAPGGLADQTNALLAAAKVKARVSFLNYDDKTGLDPNLNPTEWANGRQYGDIRDNFLVWLDDGDDVQDTWAGVTELTSDPRTGQSLSVNITLSNYAVQDHLVQRIDAFLAQIGASQGVNSSGEWTTPLDANGDPITSCKNGDTVPVISASVQNTLYAANTVYQDFQTYLAQPASSGTALGPSDFIVNQDQDFFNAYFKVIPTEVFGDPAENPYVTPLGNVGVFGADDAWALEEQETQFQQEAAAINAGTPPYAQTGTPADVSTELAWLDNFRLLTQAHDQYQYQMHFENNRLGMHMDGTDSLAFENVADHAARHCINGQWETKEQWESDLISTYWSQVAFHEFGHGMGLSHNFMGSVDRPEYPALTCTTAADCGTSETCSSAGQCITSSGSPHYTNYTSSVMEYQEAMADVYWTPSWGAYDKGAISWIYANNANEAQAQTIENEQTTEESANSVGTSLSGQATPTYPWNDPNGFTTVSGTPQELDIVFCNEMDLAYTPLCRQDDLGTTPSEIIANQISAYEWQFAWRNERQYEKFWDDSAYANSPEALFDDMRRFASLWAFDWSTGELGDDFRLLGIVNPAPTVTGDDNYYEQLGDKFNADISAANQMVAAYHEAMIQQSAGARPYATSYDPFFGDVTQQGIILDKLFAMQGFVGLWPTDNYDQNQAGSYIAYYEGLGDNTFNNVAQAAVVSMIGGGYDVYPYFVPLAVSLFAQDTHDPNWPSGADYIRNWIGNQTYVNAPDFKAYFQQLAENESYSGVGCYDPSSGAQITCNCGPTLPCNYDPTLVSASDPEQENQFTGPDGKRYIWTSLPQRNNLYVIAERDTNIVTYGLLAQYNADINIAMDDGEEPGAAEGDEYQIVYTVDAFNQFNDVTTNTSN